MTNFSFLQRARLRVAALIASVAIIAGCTENLPTGPAVFANTTLRYLTAHDTIVVGDTALATARASDAVGNQVQGLTFGWSSSDSNVVGLVSPTSDDGAAGRVKSLVGKKTGTSVVSMTLPDQRFTTSAVSRAQTVVVAGVRILSTHDSTLTAINDTGRAIAAGLVHQNGASVTRASTGLRWTHRGTHTLVVGAGDTVRYISQSPGVDTLIASHDLCLAGAKCADTAVVRVTQTLSLSLSTHAFLSWSFRDSVTPTITLADRRGFGLTGTSIQFVPVGASDAAVAAIAGPFGTSNFSAGVMATPRAISIGNGTARIAVRALGIDGSTIIATDTFTLTVRQVARRVSVFPIRAVMSIIDSVPVQATAFDARGFTIGDATITITPTGTNLTNPSGIYWAGPNGPAVLGTTATLDAVLTGAATPAANPLAPQIAVAADQAQLTLAGVDTVVAGTTQRTYGAQVFDTASTPAALSWVRYHASANPQPDSTQVSGVGSTSVVWNPPNTAGSYTLTGVRSTPTLATLSDSAGRIVLRRSVVVKASTPDVTRSSVVANATTVAVNGTTTITVSVNDIFGNAVLDATPSTFTIAATRGAIGGFACVAGVCQGTYTAPATSGADAITVQINGLDVLNSPVAITVP